MRKTTAGIMALGAAMLVSSSALAQDSDFGGESTLVLSADRLFGFYSYSMKDELEIQGVSYERTQSGTMINLLWGSATTGGESPNAGAIPRLGFDFFVAENISIGGSLGYVSASGEIEEKAGGQSQSNDLPKVSAFAIAPRVGYGMMFDDTLGIWPRAGITYFNYKSESETGTVTYTSKGNYLDVNLEVPLIISPAPNFAFHVGPVIDFGISGKAETEQKDSQSGTSQKQETDSSKLNNFGLAAGLLGWF